MFKPLFDLSFTLAILKTLNLIQMPWLHILIPAGIWIVLALIDSIVQTLVNKEKSRYELETNNNKVVNLTVYQNGIKTLIIKDGHVVYSDCKTKYQRQDKQDGV